MCTVLLPPGVNSTAVNKYIIAKHDIHVSVYHDTIYENDQQDATVV